MAERELIVDHIRLSYEGLFDAKDLYAIIDKFFREKGYDKRELRHIETVKPEGKYVEMELLPWKKTTDYIRNEIWLRLIMMDVKEVEVEKDGTKIKLNQGKIQVVMDGYFTTDYENRWEQKPTFVLIRTLFDKYFLKSITDKYKAVLIEDAHLLHSTIKSYLNMYRY